MFHYAIPIYNLLLNFHFDFKNHFVICKFEMNVATIVHYASLTTTSNFCHDIVHLMTILDLSIKHTTISALKTELKERKSNYE